jgi:hypothetical protein
MRVFLPQDGGRKIDDGGAGARVDARGPAVCRHCAEPCACVARALAAATGRPAPDAATDPGWAAFELCQHGGSANDNSFAPGGAPESSDTHCIFCLAGVSYALEAPLPSVAFHIIAITIAPWIFTVWLLPALTVDASARPRGPPPAA